MAEPKKRTNNAKQGMRRQHDKVTGATLVYCSKCHEPRERHKVCYNCGHYGEEKVLNNK